MKLRTAVQLLFVGAVSIGFGTDANAQNRLIDQGVFTVLKGGAPARSESFRIQRTEQGLITATGRLTTGAQHSASELTTDTTGTPIIYKLDVTEGGAKIVELRASARGGRLSSMSSSKGGDEAMREFPLTAGRSLIIDAGLVHHLYFVPLGKGPGAVHIIEPRAMRGSQGQLSARGMELITVAGKNVTATQYSLVAGALRYDFWVDAKGRLLRVDGPDGLSATRDELPR